MIVLNIVITKGRFKDVLDIYLATVSCFTAIYEFDEVRRDLKYSK